jgi:hypothetical protein
VFDVGVEALAVDGPVEQAGRIDAVVAQGGKESRGLPRALRDLVDEPLGPSAPSRLGGSYWSWSRACPHEGGGFIDEEAHCRAHEDAVSVFHDNHHNCSLEDAKTVVLAAIARAKETV